LNAAVPSGDGGVRFFLDAVAEEPMTYERRQFPEFSWSYSRDRMLAQCPRKYWWRYYAGHNGWERDAEGTASWWAWRLSKLTSYQAALGGAIHEVARIIAVTVQDGVAPPSESDLIERIRSDLNELWRNRTRRDDFLMRPKDVRLTTDDYYGVPTAPHRLARIREQIPQLVTAVSHSPIWDEIRRQQSNIILFDSLEACHLDDCLLYAAPDLVFGSDHTGWTIVDWKTGRVEEVSFQLSTYGLFLKPALGKEPGVSGFRGLAVGLADGTIEEIRITDEVLDTARSAINRSIGIMRSLLDDPGSNRPKPMAEFPMTPKRQACRWCEYRQTCIGQQPAD
jgi:hypothetical protein